MVGFLEVIWGSGEAEYFYERDWTGQISLKLLRNIAQSRTRHQTRRVRIKSDRSREPAPEH
jgi:hypothetical protein